MKINQDIMEVCVPFQKGAHTELLWYILKSAFKIQIFKMKKRIYLKKIKNRIITIRIEIIVLFLISISIVLLSELIFSGYPAKTEFQYKFGQIIIKLSYSFVSAFIFYFIVVHIPKETKKINTYRIISVKIGEISMFLVNILFQLEQNSGDTLQGIDFDKSTLTKTLKKIDAFSPVSALKPLNIVFNDWYDFIHFNGDEIKRLSTEIFLFNENIDSEVLELVGQINQIVSWSFSSNQGKPGNKDLVLFAEQLTKLNKVYNLTQVKFREKYGLYHIEITHKMKNNGEYDKL